MNDHLNSRVAELERVVHALATAPQSPNRAQQGGTYKLLNDDGEVVFFFGETSYVGDTPSYGVKCVVPGGAGVGTHPTVFQVDGDGLESPWLDMGVHKTDDLVVVTSGTFASIWQGWGMLVVARAVKVRGSVVCAASTTGEVRIVTGSVTSAVVSCAAGAQTDFEYNLLTGANLLGTTPINIDLEARRVSGAGDVSVFAPQMAQVGDDGSGATATGL